MRTDDGQIDEVVQKGLHITTESREVGKNMPRHLSMTILSVTYCPVPWPRDETNSRLVDGRMSFRNTEKEPFQTDRESAEPGRARTTKDNRLRSR